MPVTGQDRLKAENERLRAELAARRERSADEQRQLERYASDLRETFKEERARAEELRDSYVATVRALSNAVEARDAYTGKHAERVAAYGLLLTRRIDPALADDPQCEFGFLLHDVGKVAVPDEVLHKPDDLRDDESEVMRTHVEIGWQIVRGVPFLERAAEIVRAHHERWDGSGYPDGLSGEEIRWPRGSSLWPTPSTRLPPIGPTARASRWRRPGRSSPAARAPSSTPAWSRS